MAQMDKVKFLSPIEAPNIDVTGDIRIQGNKVLTDTDSITEAGKLSSVYNGTSGDISGLIWKVYQWEVKDKYSGVHETYSIMDKECSFHGILAVNFRTGSTMPSYDTSSHDVKWLSANKKPPAATTTYVFNDDNSVTFILYIAYPNTWTTLTLAKIHEHFNDTAVTPTFINEKVTEVTGTVLDTASSVDFTNSIKLQDGAIGTSSIDANGSINIPVTDIKEAYLNWGGKNIVNGVTPLDTATSNLHAANRFAFAYSDGITVEYSQDGGSTWTDYNAVITNQEDYNTKKIKLVSGVDGGGGDFKIGGRNNSNTIDDKLRITFDATSMGVYTVLVKLLIEVTTYNAKGGNVTIEKAMKGSDTTFSTVGTYELSGWSGWNSIPINKYGFGGGNTQTWNIAKLRLTFGITGTNGEATANDFTVNNIVAIGTTYWSTPSTMAKTGHIYSYDVNQNATFPAEITATSFNGIATKAVQDGDGNNIVNTYVTKNELAEAIISTLNTSV